MRCPRCDTQWPDELKSVMKFCGACGAQLSAEPAQATASAHPGLLRFPPAEEEHTVNPGGELRYVTVLFADLANFTAFAEDLPPDEVARIVGDLLQRLGKVVDHYGGGIDKFLGDAVVATFGLPNPDPNAARNAVRAGMAMQAAAVQFNAEQGLNFGLRVGIHAGEVMFRAIGGSWTVMGDTVNTASRLQSAAQPGKVWISRPVYEEVRRFFTLFPRPVVDLKGKKQATQPYEVIDERYTPFADMPRFVGRENDWQFLQTALRQAAEERTLTAVLVRGPAGIGKSRLMWELRDWLQKQSEVYWVDLVQYDTSDRLPSHGLNALLRGRFGLPLDLDDEQTQEQLHKGIREEGLYADLIGVQRTAAYFGFILGLNPPDSPLHQLDGKTRWEETFLAVKDWLERRAAGGTTVLFIEDVQKGDADTAAFFEWALQVQWNGPALVIFTAREEDFGPQSVWYAPLGRWLQQGSVSELRLREIAPAVIAQAIEDMADGQIPPAMALRIAEHTEGNPLFATEIVLLLKERGILDAAQVDWSQLTLPGSIRDVMEARIERLGHNGKEVAKRGALMGRRFTREAVRRIWERVPADLESGFVSLHETETTYEEASKLFMGEKENVFRHGRLHEAVLARIPREERLKWLKELRAWALDKLEGLPGDHWYSTGLLLIPLIIHSYDEHAETRLASLWSEVLGSLYIQLNRSADAIQYLRQALGSAQGVRRLVLGQQLAQSAFTAGQYDLALQQIDLARQPGPAGEPDSFHEPSVSPLLQRCLDELHDQPLIAWCSLGPAEAEMALDITQAEILGQIGKVEDARQVYREVEKRLKARFPGRHSSESAVALLWLRWSRSAAYFLSEILSQHAAALEVCRLVRQQFDLEEFSDEQRISYLYSESLVEMNLGHLERARSLVDERLRIAQQHGLQREEANCNNFLGNLAAQLGRIEESRVYYQRSLDLSRQLGLRRAEAITLFNLGEAALQLGEWEQAQQYAEQYLAASRQIGNHFAEAYARLIFSAVDQARGSYDHSAQWIEQAAEIADQHGWRRLDGFIRSSRAGLVFQRGLVEHDPLQLQKAADLYAALEQQGSLDDIDDAACFILAICCTGQAEKASEALQRVEANFDPHSELNHAWLLLLQNLVAGRSIEANMDWFCERHYASGCQLVSLVKDYLAAPKD